MARKQRQRKVLLFPDAGKCPYCSGTVQAHHGDTMECTGCGQLLDKSALVAEVMRA